MRKTTKSRAPGSDFTSTNQLSFAGFETPFYNQLDTSNRWVLLSNLISGGDLVYMYNKRNPPKATGRHAMNPRVLIGAVIIKHMLNVDDRESRRLQRKSLMSFTQPTVRERSFGLTGK